MDDNTSKPTKTRPATPATSTATRARPSVTKPAAQPSAAKAATPMVAKPVRKLAAISVKAATTAAKKTIARPAVKKLPLVKGPAPETTPIVAKDNKAAGNKKGKPAKAKKPKLVRDSFTMPEAEYALIATLKKRCLDAGVSAKKSEILRAAVAKLAKLSDASVLAAIRSLELIKTGRPAKASK